MLEVLAFGVTLEWLEKVNKEGWDLGSGDRNSKENIEKSMQLAKPQFEAIKNVNWTIIQWNPDDPEMFSTYLEKLKSKKYDAISIGGGLRTIPKLTKVFTDVVNSAKNEHPNAILVFPLAPHEIVPVLKDQIPDLS